MVSFRDQVLLGLSDPAVLGAALLPDGDTVGRRVQTMLAASYDLSSARIDQVTGLAVRAVSLQRPLFPVGRRSGSWSQTVPSFTRGELTLEVPAPADPVWVDLLAELDVTVVAEIDPAGAEAVLSRSLDDFTSLDDFRARFAFIDLDAFMARHRITTVEELREAFDYLVTEVRLRRAPPFDRGDPANAHVLPVTLAAVVVDPVDLAGALRLTRLVTEAARPLVGAVPATVAVEPTEAYATAVVLSAAGLGDGLTAEAVENLFAREGVATLLQQAS
jgi:hypothetical protein